MDLGSREIVLLHSKNKDADQLHGYHTAELRLSFHKFNNGALDKHAYRVNYENIWQDTYFISIPERIIYEI